jgi:acid phosphatase
MGSHLTLERMTCNATALSKAGVFVCAIINEALIPWSTCQSGPGFLRPLANYSTMIRRVPTLEETCDTPAGYPKYLDFFFGSIILQLRRGRLVSAYYY